MNIYIRKQGFLLRRVIVSVLVIVVTIGFLNIFQSQVRNSFYVISKPAVQGFRKSGNATLGFFASFLPDGNVKKENILLRQENQNLLSRLTSLQDSLRQNYIASTAAGVAKENNFSLAMVNITALDSADDFILIDGGLEDGISENMPVISNEKVLYGKVHQVYKNFSKVMLISNSVNVLDVKIQNDEPESTPVYGAVKGMGAGALYLDLVSSDSQINEGDILTTSALEGIFPRNLLVGQIVSTEKNDLKPFQTAQVQQFFDVKNTDTLFVITDYIKK